MERKQRVVRKRRVAVWDPSGANRVRWYQSPPRNTTFKALLAFGVALFTVASVVDAMNPEVQVASVKKDLTDPSGVERPLEKQVAFVKMDGAPIPEPSATLLLAVSSLALLRRRR